MMSTRRRMLMRCGEKSVRYLYNNGTVGAGLSFMADPPGKSGEWTNTLGSFAQAETLPEGFESYTGLGVHISDTGSDIAKAACIENSGITGRELKRYGTLNFSYYHTGTNLPIFSDINSRVSWFCLYSPDDEWGGYGDYCVEASKYILNDDKAVINTVSINIADLELEDDRTYYIGFVRVTQTGWTGTADLYIPEIWLSKKG